AALHNTVGISLGDIAWNELNMFEPYKQAIKKTGIPFYTVIGNHDFIQNKSGKAAEESYEDAFGPVNWAFWLGEDLVVGLNNIRFRGEVEDPKKSGKYDEGYPEWSMDFMRELLKFIPKGTHIFIAQHSPTYHWFKDRYIVNGKEMIAMLEGYKVDFLSGHTHILNNFKYTEDIREHNPAAICGAWWETTWCNDGTPRGYHIFDRVDGELSYYWHNVDYPDDYQVEFIAKGESRFNPDCYIANVWDYDENWTIEWFQDGVSMGAPEMVKDVSPTYISQIEEKFKDRIIPKYKRPRKNIHYFAVKTVGEAHSIVMEVSAPDGRKWSHEFIQ
nr:calcineurin-like phosphoesterase C-terminal domain-containing protein [Bacteroidales bacterium]